MTPLIEALGPALDLAPGMIQLAFLVFLRIGAAMALVPAFGEVMVPARVRLVLALGFTAITLAGLPEGPPPDAAKLAALIPREVGTGLAIGLALRLTVLALQTAAAVIGQSIALTQIFPSPSGEGTPALGNLMLMAAFALAIGLDLHLRLAALFIRSYAVLPPGPLGDLPARLAEWGLAAIAHAFATAMAFAAPFMAVSLLLNLALGLANRALAALPLFLIATPAQVWGGLILLILILPIGLHHWSAYLLAVLADPLMVPE